MKCKKNIINIIRIGVILVFLLNIFISSIFSQIDTSFTDIQKDILRTEDLVFSIDSSRLKMISAGVFQRIWMNYP